MAVSAGFFLAAWYLHPSLLTGKLMVLMASAPTLVLSVGLYLFRSLGSVGSGGLNEREASSLAWRKADIRRRLYRLGAFALATSTCLALVVADGLQATTPILAFITGALIGLMFQYLIVLVSWLEQLSAFRDDQERRSAVAKQREHALKGLKS